LRCRYWKKCLLNGNSSDLSPDFKCSR